MPAVERFDVAADRLIAALRARATSVGAAPQLVFVPGTVVEAGPPPRQWTLPLPEGPGVVAKTPEARTADRPVSPVQPMETWVQPVVPPSPARPVTPANAPSPPPIPIPNPAPPTLWQRLKAAIRSPFSR